jgi:hypothetical protein
MTLNSGFAGAIAASLGARAQDSADEAPGDASAADIELFQQALLEAAQVRGAVVARTSASPGASPLLSGLADHLHGRAEGLSSRVSRVVASRDPVGMMQATAHLVDSSIETTLIAKVIGKTVSAVDQLTKLS